MNEFVELIPWIKFTIVMYNFYLFCRIFSNETIRVVNWPTYTGYKKVN